MLTVARGSAGGDPIFSLLIHPLSAVNIFIQQCNLVITTAINTEIFTAKKKKEVGS
jgi:hypothetical protein